MHKVLNNKQTIEDKLIVCLSNIFLSFLIKMYLCITGKTRNMGIKRKSQQDEDHQTNFPHGPRGNAN